MNGFNLALLSTLTNTLLGRTGNNSAALNQGFSAHCQSQALAQLLPFSTNSAILPPQQQNVSLLPQTNHPPESTSVRNGSSDSDSYNSTYLCTKGGGANGICDVLVSNSKARQEEALHRSSKILLCRARGMPMNHSGNTASLEIPVNALHGEDLVCSHPICRQGGIKFLLCKYCDEPVAKRSFYRNHGHKDMQRTDESSPSQKKKSNRQKDDHIAEEKKSRDRKRQKVNVTETSIQV
ncbi:hypothetical protein IV203_016362 [Nitzschia inconspicua]|uniref:Uncharacterized protein n=1 Tax=Nitzschia inconspicua TaxID=303405 RepID=A0A9K3K573_9STRA|nr:hypothetical protein IV203_017418 [Nitzschia inconspicua]KAG7347657.1 hypothetical protein IV203_016362 [Nitzschia inconspicua]